MNVIDELRDMNFKELYGRPQLTDEELDDWLASMGLLNSFQVCDFCTDHMNQRTRTTWVCHKRESRCANGDNKPVKSHFVGTFFEGARISRKNIFLLGTVTKIEFEAKVAHANIVHWYNKFRKLCRKYFHAHPIFIGGHNIAVEIDESFMTTRKGRFHRRVRRYPFWLFGGVELTLGMTFSCRPLKELLQC
jgi:hypothetical protein